MQTLTARDVMTRNVITVPADATLDELVAILSEHMISGAPVVDDVGRLVGVVSTSDIARHGASRARDVWARVAPDFYLRGWDLVGDDVSSFFIGQASDLKVRDIMTPTIFSVSESATVDEMAGTMVGGRIHRLLVMDGERAVGIVTTLDLVKLLCQGDRPF